MYREKLIQLIKSPAIGDIFRWSKGSHKSVVYICLLNLLLACSGLVITLATKGLIDGATGKDLHSVVLYTVIMIVTVVIIRLANVINSLISTKANAVLLKNMRTMILQSLMKKQYSGIDGFHSGELVNRMFSDVSVVKSGIMGIVPRIVSMSVSFVGAAIILISMDWRFVVLLIIGGLLGLFFILVFKAPMKTRHKAVQETEGRLHASIQETVENLRIIKASCSEERMDAKSEKDQRSFFRAQLKKGYFSAGMNAAIGTVFHVSWLICMLWGCRGIYTGELTYGAFAAILQLVGQIQGPIAGTADVAAQAYGTVSSAERLKEILDLPDEEESVCPEGISKDELYTHLRSISFNDVYFSYDREPVLQGLRTVIKPGDFVALTGVSGEGKSTMFQLLLGIYKPEGGSVDFDIDGVNYPASKMTRAMFAYVPQGNILFSGTLRENIAMFSDNATDEEIIRAARIACIDHLIDRLDDGLDTVLGERGVGLSEGQGQRVAVARALLSGAPILLLDECTSALDEETEARLLKNINDMKNDDAMPDRTCIIVTHRKAALSICDCRLHVEKGVICD